MIKNQIYLNILSSVYPIIVQVFDDCENIIFNEELNCDLHTCLCMPHHNIHIEIIYQNQTQFYSLNAKFNRCFFWSFQPINIIPTQLKLQSFKLTDLNYGLPISAVLNFKN